MTKPKAESGPVPFVGVLLIKKIIKVLNLKNLSLIIIFLPVWRKGSPVEESPVRVVFHCLLPATQARHVNIVKVAADHFQTKHK